MTELAGWPVALTCDDAPTSAGRVGGSVHADPARMDAIRETLQAAGIERCVAFVVGGRAVGEEDRLRRWLEAGFELGNHTWSHARASQAEVATFLADVDRCDALLDGVGAFAGGRRRFFRFPYLDRGRDAQGRSALGGGLRRRRYVVAHASVDFFDYLYDARAEESARRYARVARMSCAHEARRLGRRTGRRVPLIAFFHFGPSSARALGEILGGLAGVRWCSLEEALADPVYRSFDEDVSRNGLVPNAIVGRSLGQRIGRRLAGLSSRTGLFRQGRLGPRWPYL